LGTWARWAALAFGFEVLSAQTMVTSALLTGNAASNAVSRKCGYVDDGLQVVQDGGERKVLRRYRLTVQAWRAADRPPVELAGHHSLANLFA
jgi:RimJ/RimL family protein N-acetyltransferase